MRSKFHHEEIYRGKDLVKTLANIPIVVCGAGALGSNLVENLARQGCSNLTVIDMDRVEAHNLNTQVWVENDIGALKGDALKTRIFRSVGFEIQTINKKLTETTVAKFLKKATLIIDVFDNSASRKLVYDFARDHQIDCIHGGMNTNYGEIVWNEDYMVPGDVEGDVCDYPLARNLIMLVIAILSEEIILYCLNPKHKRRNLSITLKDLKVTPYK